MRRGLFSQHVARLYKVPEGHCSKGPSISSYNPDYLADQELSIYLSRSCFQGMRVRLSRLYLRFVKCDCED